MTSLSMRHQLESIVACRFRTVFTSKENYTSETIATGIQYLDRVIGGIGRGSITELCGSVSSGRSSVLLSLLAELSCQQEACALVDVSDTFNPQSAVAAGIDLKQ